MDLIMTDRWKVITKAASALAVFLLKATLTILSIYLIWGWITINDMRKYCIENGLDFEKTMHEIMPALDDYEIKAGESGPSVKVIPEKKNVPISRYIVPFLTVDVDKNSASFFHGALLEPILGISENTRNATFCFSIGYLVGLFIVALEYLKGKQLSTRRLILRPTLGGISSMLLFIIILSGGSLIWNEVNGVKGLSIGIIATIGSIYCEKFTNLVSF